MARGHLILTERYQVQALHRLGFSQASIARRIGRHPSTISRELRRNADSHPYQGDRAHRRSQRRRQQASGRPRIPAAHWALIEAQLRLEHSPEQIAGRTGLASHERIYRHIATDYRSGGTLHRHLRRQKPRRRRRASPDRRGSIRFRRDISQRPAIVDTRSRIGDWELDTMVQAGGGAALVTLTERRSGLHLVRKVARRTATAVCRAIVAALHPLRRLVHTLTSDNGTEFAAHEVTALALEAEHFFAQPYAAWQRGSNENANGLVRQYLPKGTDLDAVSDAQVQWTEDRLNHRPRKRLGFRTPFEVFFEAFNQGVATQS